MGAADRAFPLAIGREVRTRSQGEFSGKPPKSPAYIRPIVGSIHNAIENPQPGPYIPGLPPLERKVVAAAANRHVLALRPQHTPANFEPCTNT